MMKNQSLVVLLFCLLSIPFPTVAQEAYFIDGYHGGVYGHYPIGQTDFITKMLKKHPDWDTNLEIELDTWDAEKLRDREASHMLKKLFTDKSIWTWQSEYITPPYSQRNLLATTGQSNTCQFSYGMEF